MASKVQPKRESSRMITRSSILGTLRPASSKTSPSCIKSQSKWKALRLETNWRQNPVSITRKCTPWNITSRLPSSVRSRNRLKRPFLLILREHLMKIEIVLRKLDCFHTQSTSVEIRFLRVLTTTRPSAFHLFNSLEVG